MATDRDIAINMHGLILDEVFSYDETKPTIQQEKIAWLLQHFYNDMAAAGFRFNQNPDSIQEILLKAKIDPVTDEPYELINAKAVTIAFTPQGAQISYRGE